MLNNYDEKYVYVNPGWFVRRWIAINMWGVPSEKGINHDSAKAATKVEETL